MIMNVSIQRVTRTQAEKSGHTKRALVVFDPHELLPPSNGWDESRLVIEPPVPEATTTEAVVSYNDRLADAKIASLTNTIARQDEIINSQAATIHDITEHNQGLKQAEDQLRTENARLAREHVALDDHLTKVEKRARDLSTQVQRGRVAVREIRRRLDRLDPPVIAPTIRSGRFSVAHPPQTQQRRLRDDEEQEF
jgi:hypothetical protein